jgi:phosphatidylglycerol:prolipoprotein diacylglycerol transferase
MHPTLFRIGSFPVGTYGLLLALGFFAALALARKLGAKDGLPGEALSDLAISLLLAGIIGAKVLMLVVDLAGGKPLGAILDLGYLRAGGAVHGGIIAGAIVFFWRIKKLKLPLPATLDALGPAIALGQAIGRLGCFSAGCCYGTVCSAPWAVVFRNPEAYYNSGTPLNVPLHPVQLYASFTNFTIMGLLLLLGRHRRFKGQVLASYFVLEGLGRTLVETWRDDPDRGVWLGQPWISTGRITAFAFIVFGLVLWFWLRRIHRRTLVTA